MAGQIRYLQHGGVEYYIDGKKVSKEEHDAAFPPKELGGSGPYANPLWAGGAWVSDALMVHPSQRQEAIEWSKKVGVPTHYREDGTPEVLDRNHRKQLLKAHGMHDNRGGYGD